MDLTLYYEDVEEMANLVDAKRRALRAELVSHIGRDDDYQCLEDYNNLWDILQMRLSQGLHGRKPV